MTEEMKAKLEKLMLEEFYELFWLKEDAESGDSTAPWFVLVGDPHGCVPASILGEDLCQDIWTRICAKDFLSANWWYVIITPFPCCLCVEEGQAPTPPDVRRAALLYFAADPEDSPAGVRAAAVKTALWHLSYSNDARHFPQLSNAHTNRRKSGFWFYAFSIQLPEHHIRLALG